MRVLVTGGGGFIGSHVVDRLQEKGMTPRIFDLSASPYHSPLEVETFTGSITDPANLDLAMRDCDAVIHLAAVADVSHVLADPVLAEEVNTRGTLNVLEAACRANVGRVVYGSTTWVYSDCPEQEVDEETAIPAPRHLYTATKLAGETYCSGYAELYDLESTVLRFGIPYGPRARAAGVVAKFTDLSFEGKALTIAGDGSTTRSFIYVEDLAAGIVASLAPEAAGRTYNLSGDEVVTILEIAERVQENVETCEITHTPPRPGDFPGKTISNQRALDELGWKAETSFKEGVRKYVEWVRCTTRPPDPIPGTRPSMNGNEHAAGALLAGAARFEEREPRVLILTADIGEGHDLPARMIKAELEAEAPDVKVEIANGLEAMGRLHAAVIRGGSHIVFRWAHWMFDFQYWLVAKFAPTRWLAHHLMYAFGARGLLQLIARQEPDVIVSTYPGVTAVLGMLRENRRLPIPVQSAITDLAGLRYWVHPGVDLHFVTHPESIEEVERLAGPGSVEWMRPPIAREFLMPRTRSDARAALDLPPHARVVLVSGGGWGIGPRGRDQDRALGWRHPGRLHHRPQRGRSRAARAALRGQRAGADHRLHRSDERLDGRRRRDGPRDRRTDRARGPHPRLSGRLLRLQRRPPARQQRRLRALRPGRGGALRARARVGPAPRHPRATLARLLVRLAAGDLLAGTGGAAAGPPAAGLEAARQPHRDGRCRRGGCRRDVHRRCPLAQLGSALPEDR